MTPAEFKNLKSAMFASRDSVEEAFDYVDTLAHGSEGIVIWTAVMVVVNTLVDTIDFSEAPAKPAAYTIGENAIERIEQEMIKDKRSQGIDPACLCQGFYPHPNCPVHRRRQ